MFEQAKRDWTDALNSPDPSVRIQHRLLLKTHGSEFGYRRVYDPRRENVASNIARTQLIGPDPTTAEITAGSRQLVIPQGRVAIVEEMNLRYAENAGGTVTAAMHAVKLQLKVNNEALARFPTFTLNHFHKGDNGLLFGALPLGITVPPEAKLRLFLEGAGAGGDAMIIQPSLLIRFEPLWLWQLAGLSLQDEPS